MRFFKFADIVTWIAIIRLTWNLYWVLLKIDDLALKKPPFYRQENKLFLHNYAIFLDFDIFWKSYVIVQEIPSSSTTFFPFSVLATQSAGIMSAVEELFFLAPPKAAHKSLGSQYFSKKKLCIIGQI